MKVGTHLITEYGLDVDDLVKLMGWGVDLTEVVHVVKVGEDVIPITRKSLDHAVGRHVDGTENVGRIGTTLFPTSEPVTSYGVPYPGISTLTREQMIDKIPKWIDEAIKAELTEWPNKPIHNFKHCLSNGERGDVTVIEVCINRIDGIATTFPVEGPQVFRWYNNKWNPTV